MNMEINGHGTVQQKGTLNKVAVGAKAGIEIPESLKFDLWGSPELFTVCLQISAQRF